MQAEVNAVFACLSIHVPQSHIPKLNLYSGFLCEFFALNQNGIDHVKMKFYRVANIDVVQESPNIGRLTLSWAR